MKLKYIVVISTLALAVGIVAANSFKKSPIEPDTSQNINQDGTKTERQKNIAFSIHPEIWPKVVTTPLDPAIEAQIDDIIAKMTVEQKVGQTIQADSAAVTPEEVKQYRLGSVLSGGNTAPGPLPYADAKTWLETADTYYQASIDPEGVEIAIPLIWGIDAVHGHANLLGATIFPHNIGLGAANNPDLIEKISEITARELVVSGHDWTFAPTLAVPRDDRWGRAYEGFSEAPEIVASYSDRIVYGLQGRPSNNSFMGSGKVLSAAKHFLADGGTDNGVDQGDAKISEAELINIHAAGYIPALKAGVQSVMASFSSWNGIKLTGSKELLTDVLKSQMGFQGFVVSDWNAHGQLEGCTNTDCPQAFNAGIDMFMAPDSWKGIYESTLQHAKSGRISMERLDDAVRRILRVKILFGIFDKPKPSERPFAGDASLLGSTEHRSVARQAVRESLVLLKNNDNLLPLDASKKILVVGKGADNIAKISGGWTLSWQGGVHTNDEFPNGQSILSGIKEIVKAKGGTVIYDPDGTADVTADVVIAVYGEDPYAEFQGDRATVDFEENDFDTDILATYQQKKIPTVSVFISGRPLWVNPEINNSSAFVAAWLPGSEGAGVADMLFRPNPDYDFTGRLPFSWPKNALQSTVNKGDDIYDPQFPYGYGLSYASTSNLGELSEESGLEGVEKTNSGVFFSKGLSQKPWSMYVMANGSDTRITATPWNDGGLSIAKTDRLAQEDSLKLTWDSAGPEMRLTAFTPIDLSRQTTGAMELAFFVKSFDQNPINLKVGMGCTGSDNCRHAVPLEITSNDWTEKRVNLSCFQKAGMDMTAIGEAFFITSEGKASIGLSEIRIESDIDAKETCGDVQ